MLRAHLGLGSNLGDRWGFVGRAVERLCQLDPQCVVSPLYETAPVGGPPGQGPYLNAVVRLAADLAPEGFLELAAALEREAGRVRVERNGARTLDVDVLLLDELVVGGDGATSVVALRVDTEALVVPHPRLFERPFVLAPLADCSPELVPPSWQDRFGGELAVAGSVRKVGEIVRLPAP